MTKKYRQGAVGALLDEYERAMLEFEQTIAGISNEDLVKIVDHETGDTNCRSVQTILSHVVRSGFSYAIYIRQLLGQHMEFRDRIFHSTIDGYIKDLQAVFTFTADTFANINDSQLEQHDNGKKLMTSWGQIYDIEQITEHAIVHILRHRRQIEKFKMLLYAGYENQ